MTENWKEKGRNFHNDIDAMWIDWSGFVLRPRLSINHTSIVSLQFSPIFIVQPLLQPLMIPHSTDNWNLKTEIATTPKRYFNLIVSSARSLTPLRAESQSFPILWPLQFLEHSDAVKIHPLEFLRCGKCRSALQCPQLLFLASFLPFNCLIGQQVFII